MTTKKPASKPAAPAAPKAAPPAAAKPDAPAAPKPAPEAAPKAAPEPAPEPPKAPAVSVVCIYDAGGEIDARAAGEALEAAGIPVEVKRTGRGNYHRHEDRAYVPENLGDAAAPALAILNGVRHMHETASSEGDTIYAWFVR